MDAPTDWKALWERDQARLRELEAQNEALARNEERFRMMFNHVPLGYMSMDENAHLIDVNGAFADFFGYRREEILGKAFADLLVEGHDYHRSVTFPEFKRLGYSRDVEWTVRKKDGTEAVIQMSGNVRRDPQGRFIQTHCMMLDITEKRRAALDLQEATRRERDRLGKDLHDGLGQQLTGIAYLAAALKNELQSQAAPDLPAAVHAATRIAETAGAAIEAMRSMIQGLHPLPPVPQGLAQALEALTLETTELGPLTCRWEARDPVAIDDYAVATHLFLIAKEAVHNAVKHSRGTHIEVGLTREAGAVVLRVTDDGRGLGSPQASQGTGLRNMGHRARMMGGRLEVSATPHGTQVTCQVPLAPGVGR